MMLFFATGPLESVVLDVLGLPTKPARDSTFNLIINDRLPEMTVFLVLRNSTAGTVAAALLEY